MLPGTILVFLGASDLFLGTRDASLGATLLLGTSWPFPGICQRKQLLKQHPSQIASQMYLLIIALKRRYLSSQRFTKCPIPFTSHHLSSPTSPPRPLQVLIYLPLCASASQHSAGIILKAVRPYLLLWVLPGPKIRSRTGRQMRIDRITPLYLGCAACGRCRCRCHMHLPLLQVEEEVAAQTPGLAVVGTRWKLAGAGPCVFKR
jgi:hypothetical protein